MVDDTVPPGTKTPEKPLTPEEIAAQEKLIRELHGIPEPKIPEEKIEEPEDDPMDEQPPTPENKEAADDEGKPRIVHPKTILVTNLSKKAKEDQVKTLFEFIGEVKNLKIFPKEGVACIARCAFIQFKDGINAGVSIHLSNTIFIDRPITVAIWQENNMPNDAEGLKHIVPLSAAKAFYGKTENDETGHNMIKKEMNNFANSTSGALFSMHLDDSSVLERTIHVANLDEVLVHETSLVQFMAIAGAVDKVRITGTEALIVFKLQKAVEAAMKLNGATFLGKQLIIRGAEQADQVLKKVEVTNKDDTMRRVLAAQELIEDVVGTGRDDRPLTKMEFKSESKVKSESSSSRRRRRSRSRDRSRSKSKKHKRDRDRDRSRRHRDRSRSRERSHKKSKKSRHRD